MKRSIPYVALAAALLSVLTALPAGAQPPFAGPGGAPGRGMGGERGNVLYEFLQLTDEQIDQWQTLQQDHRAANQSVRQEQQGLRRQLKEALESDTPDATVIGGLMLALRDLETELRASHEELQASLTALLTAEQLVRFEALQAAQALRPGGRGRRHGPGHGPGPGGGGQ